MSSKITLAMLAAVVGESYAVPFTGRTGFVYVEDAARVFIRAAAWPETGRGFSISQETFKPSRA